MAVLKITEIFKSIQGETSYAGLPCSFVRFCGCNLRCRYCDTKYAYFDGIEMSVDEVLQRVSELDCRLVTVTGGEPLLQDAVYPLIDGLVSAARQVFVETNGSLPIDGLNKDAVRILDLKCPDSGMCDRMDWANISQLRTVDEVKFVLSTRRDYDWAKSVIAQYRLDEKATVLMSAAWGRLKSGELADWMISDGVNARLQLQLHKLIGKP